jgi:hypothetical protein
MSGPYAICHVTFPNGSDAATYRTLRSGFKSAEAADDALADLASEFEVAWQECAIIRSIAIDEVSRFTF